MYTDKETKEGLLSDPNLRQVSAQEFLNGFIEKEKESIPAERKFQRSSIKDEGVIKTDLSNCGLFKTITSHFIMPTFRLILFPTFLIVGGIMSGHLTDNQGDSDAMLAGFGLGELTVAILSLSILHAFNGSLR